jgi:hypothetical protein
MTAKTITIGGITITVESSEQVRTTTGALYTKDIWKTYDDDKKGKLTTAVFSNFDLCK